MSVFIEVPEQFTLTVEKKPDHWWKVTSPEYPGLYLVHRDLAVILEDIPRALATLIVLNRNARAKLSTQGTQTS